MPRSKLSFAEIKSLLDPTKDRAQRLESFIKYSTDFDLDMKRFLNMLVYEYNVPDYYLEFCLRDPNLKTDCVEKEKECPKKQDQKLKKLVEHFPREKLDEPMPLINYEDVRKLSLTSTDDLGRDDTPDDTDEVMGSLVDAVKTSQHPNVTIREILLSGPMNNDLEDSDEYIWCHTSKLDIPDCNILHGMYSCYCMYYDTPNLKCSACESKISSFRDGIRLPYPDRGGWHPNLYCNTDCAFFDPPFDITPNVQLKLLLGLEIMSRIEELKSDKD